MSSAVYGWQRTAGSACRTACGRFVSFGSGGAICLDIEVSSIHKLEAAKPCVVAWHEQHRPCFLSVGVVPSTNTLCLLCRWTSDMYQYLGKMAREAEKKHHSKYQMLHSSLLYLAQWSWPSCSEVAIASNKSILALQHSFASTLFSPLGVHAVASGFNSVLQC